MNICHSVSKFVKLLSSTKASSPSARAQSGFTLLEMLVVIAVVGVLAAIAVPRFQNSLQRASFVEVINTGSPYRTGVEMCLQKGNALADCDAGQHGVPVAVGASTSGVVTSGTVDGGVITINAALGSEAYTYILTPTPAAAATSGATPSASGITWAVTGTCIAANLCDAN